MESDAYTPRRTTRPDVHAAVTVIGRQAPSHDRYLLNLEDATLIRADLAEADLAGALLDHADLTGANLTDAKLADAMLNDATLTGVDGHRRCRARLRTSPGLIPLTRNEIAACSAP